MGKIIGIQFQNNGKMYYFDANGFEVKPGDYVIVDTARGQDIVSPIRSRLIRLMQTTLQTRGCFQVQTRGAISCSGSRLTQAENIQAVSQPDRGQAGAQHTTGAKASDQGRTSR